MSRCKIKFSIYALAVSAALPIIGAGCAGAAANGVHAKLAAEEGSLDAWGLKSLEPYLSEEVQPVFVPGPVVIEEPPVELSGDIALEESTVSVVLPEEEFEDQIPPTINGNESPLTAEAIRAAIILEGCSKANWYYGNQPVCEEWNERDWDDQGKRHWEFVDHSFYGPTWDSHGPRGVYDSHDDGRFEYYRWFGEGGGIDQGDSRTDWYWEAKFIRNFYDRCLTEYGFDEDVITTCALPEGIFTDYIDELGQEIHCEGFWTGRQCSTSIHWSLIERFCSEEGSEALFCTLLKDEADAIINGTANVREKLEFEGVEDWIEVPKYKD
jgi:hypothetical protein